MKKILILLFVMQAAVQFASAQLPIFLLRKDIYENHDGDAYGFKHRKGNQNKATPPGYSDLPGDCDDNNPNVYPGAPEICGNHIDDNCNGLTDEACGGILYYADADEDGYGSPSDTLRAFSLPDGYVTTGTDCNDASPTVNPGSSETCNGVDDNCNSQTDEGDHIFYTDANHDGYGDNILSFISKVCTVPPDGYATGFAPVAHFTLVPTGQHLNLKLNGYATEDMWMTSQNVYKDARSNPFYDRLVALNPSRLLFPGGSPSHNWIPPFPYGMNFGEGYNCHVCNYGEPCAGQDISTCHLGDGYCCISWPISFYQFTIDLCQDLHAQPILVYNAERNNYDEFRSAVQYAKDSTGIEDVVLGQEDNINGAYNNDVSFPLDGISYRTDVIDPVSDGIHADFPGIDVTIDGAPAESTTPHNVQWNEDILPNNSDGITRAYLFDRHYFTLPEGGTYASYLDTINKAISIYFPARMALWQSTFPGYKIGLTEWGVDGGSLKLPYVNTTLAAIYVAKFVKAMIIYDVAHGNYIDYATYYRLASLGMYDGDPKTYYWALYQVAKLFTADALVWTVTSDIPGVEGIASQDAGGYHLLLINETSLPVALDAINIDDGTAAGFTTIDFTGEVIYGSSLSSQTMTKAAMVNTMNATGIVEVNFSLH